MKFQTILLAFFGVMAVVGLIAFSKSPSKKSETELAGAQGNVAIWGSFPDSKGLSAVVKNFNETYKGSFSISYEYHDPKTFDRDIVESLASGKGPDVLLLPDDLILRHSDKIDMISYLSVPPGVFSSNYIQAAEIYMRDDGLVALPFTIDPIVMYWNRDIFTNASITLPPQYWDEFTSMTPKLTKRNPKTADVVQSAVAFGEYVNVDHAKDIISMLFLQVGNPIVKFSKGRPSSEIAENESGAYVADQDVVSALRFYMDFSNPTKNIYTWNRAKSGSQNEFINGNLAIHFDFASAYNSIAKKNPHLNFAVAQVPQPRGTSAEITFARVHGLSVLKSSQNKKTAFIAVQKLLIDQYAAKDFAASYDLPPVRRDQLSIKPNDAALSVFYDAAIRSRTWLDPKPDTTDMIFKDMVESISSGRQDVPIALSTLNTEISAALTKY